MQKNLETFWLTELNLNQYNDVRQLLSACEKVDKGAPLIYSNSLLNTRVPAVNGLVYYHQKLIAFVSAYLFYSTACECSLMVLPKYRGRGIAKSLLKVLIPILKSQQMKAMYFTAGQAFEIRDQPQISLYSCEYQLAIESETPIIPTNTRLAFRPATVDDIDDMCELDQACFAHHEVHTMAKRFWEVIQSPQYHIIVGELDGHCIAKAHIQWLENESRLSDIAVYPIYQRQGFGSEVVHTCLVESQLRGFNKVILEVESKNEGALKLYLNQGFQIQKATNLWQVPI